MPYAAVTATSILDALREIAPHIGLVRTEHLPPIDARPGRDEITVELLPKKLTYRVHQHPDAMVEPTKQLAKMLGLALDAATDVVALTARLHQVNPRGTWVVDEADLQSTTACSDSEDIGTELKFEHGQVKHAFLADVIADLAEQLPGCSAITASWARQGMAGGNVRRRTVLRFEGSAGEELAALDAAHFGVHIASLVTMQGPHAERNAVRAGIWATQLGASMEDMPSVLHDLTMMFVNLPTRRVQLNSIAQVSQFWAKQRAA